jgi:hypothetical protein
MKSENKLRLLFRRAVSLFITFYISYLFFHFVILNAFTINSITLILLSLWAGHIILNSITLGIFKNATFGDLFVQIKFIGFKQNTNQVCQIAMRSFFTTTLFYVVIYCNYLSGWSLLVMFASLILAVVINYNYIKINPNTVTIIDWLTGSFVLIK